MTRALALTHGRNFGIPVRVALLWLLAAVFLVIQTLSAQARGPGESFADLAEQLSPSVVNITTTTVVAQPDGPGPMVPEGSPLEDLFRDFLDRRGNPEQRQRRGSALGSGFVISADGYIVTNNHVIESADEILIEFFDGAGELPAEVIGTDPRTDIALLKVEPNDPLPFVAFGDSDIARVGDWVLAIGNPLGQGFSVSAGIISARNRSLQGAYDDFIQTDAAINRGNSGGPLFQHGWRSDRREHRDPEPQWRIDRDRVLDVVCGRDPCCRPVARVRGNPARLAGRQHSERDPGCGRSTWAGGYLRRAGNGCAWRARRRMRAFLRVT